MECQAVSALIKKEEKRKEGESEGASKELVLSKADLLSKIFSNLPRINHLEGLLKHRF